MPNCHGIPAAQKCPVGKDYMKKRWTEPLVRGRTRTMSNNNPAGRDSAPNGQICNPAHGGGTCLILRVKENMKKWLFVWMEKKSYCLCPSKRRIKQNVMKPVYFTATFYFTWIERKVEFGVYQAIGCLRTEIQEHDIINLAHTSWILYTIYS